MSRIHDLGGMHGFGPVEWDPDEPAFGSVWESRVFALSRALLDHGVFNGDEFRDARERMEPAAYLSSGYYERLLHAIEALLAAKGVLEPDALDRRLDELVPDPAPHAH